MDAHIPPDFLGGILRKIGKDMNAMISLKREFMENNNYLTVDLTHVLSMRGNNNGNTGT